MPRLNLPDPAVPDQESIPVWEGSRTGARGGRNATARQTPFDESITGRRRDLNAAPKSTAGSRRSASPASRDSEVLFPRTSTASTELNGESEPYPIAYEVTGIFCILGGCLLLINALAPAADGWLPRLGIHTLRWLFGSGAVLAPVLLLWFGILLIARQRELSLLRFTRGAGTAFLIILTALHLGVERGQEFDHSLLLQNGGAVGAVLAWLLRTLLGDTGAVLALCAFTLISLLLLTGSSLRGSFQRAGGLLRARSWILRLGRPRGLRIRPSGGTDEAASSPWQRGRSTPRPDPLASSRLQDKPAAALPGPHGERTSPFLPLSDLLGRDATSPPLNAPPPGARVSPATTPPSSVPSGQLPLAAAPLSLASAPPGGSVPGEDLTPTEKLEAEVLASSTSGPKTRRSRPARLRRRFLDGPLMPEYFDDVVRALDPPVVYDTAGTEDDIQVGVHAVQETLASFRVEARVTDVKRGPVITRYEVQPAPGVRVAAIANLDRDLARTLAAVAVRIEAPVPGKNVVGIEVPNKRVHLVRLRDVLDLPDFLRSPSKLAFVLGKDIAGQPKWADLARMPHLLIAGATNSGKSVCLNAIISSIISRATPDEVKFSLIDPKRVELTLYRDIPHLYHPVVVEPKDAVRALRGAIAEMDRRYRKFAERGVRNLASFNSKLQEGEDPLPYVVIVIDELADLMMTAAAEFEKLICRLAQLARATGIHLIIATQRPSVNVITGVIKANIPARIAFAVASQVDSRTILDTVGADRLIGSGDMLYDANSGGKPLRIQGAYLSEEEVNHVVEVVKNYQREEQKPLQYGLNLEEIADEPLEGDSGDDEARRDDLYDEVKSFVMRHAEMSASMIQRKFEIGYPRAGRIVDQLERDGVLTPPDGSKARKVIASV